MGGVLGGIFGGFFHLKKRRWLHPIRAGRMLCRCRFALARSSRYPVWRRADLSLSEGGVVLLLYPHLYKWTPKDSTFSFPSRAITEVTSGRDGLRVSLNDGDWIEVKECPGFAEAIAFAIREGVPN